MNLGGNLITLREKLNINLKDMAKTLQVSDRMVRLYEKGEYPVNSDALGRLIKKYNINPVWLFLNKGEMLLEDQELKSYTEKIKEKFQVDEPDLDRIITETVKKPEIKEAFLTLLDINDIENKEALKKITELFSLISL